MNRKSNQLILVLLFLISIACNSSSLATPDIALQQTQVALQQTQVALQQTKVALQQIPDVAATQQPASNSSVPTLPASSLVPTTTTNEATPFPNSPSPVLPPGSFADNFDSGVLQPGWEGSLDRFRIADGVLTVKYPNSRDTLFFSNISTTNYSIEFDVVRFPGDCWVEGNGWTYCNDYQELFIYTRYQDSEHNSVVKIPFNHARHAEGFLVYWDLVGIRTGTSQGNIALPDNGGGRTEFSGHVCMELINTKYTMLFNGKPLISFDDGTDSLREGKIALTMEWQDIGDLRPSGGVDNFRVIPNGTCILP